jgi:hypothetical protein
MDPAPAKSVAPAFDPRDWMELYLRGRHDKLSGQMLAILRHFRETTYVRLERGSQRFVDEFVKNFLYFFTQADFVPGRADLAEFVRHNPTIANLAAMSRFGTTAPYLELLADRPAALAKTLTLCSARNTAALDRKALFDADPALASVWYGAYAALYRSGLLRQDVYDNLCEHFAFTDDRLDVRLFPLDSYFASTYVGGDRDRVIKPVLNRAVKAMAGLGEPLFGSDPDPRKIAVLSGNWSPAHSVYRITEGYLRALRGYHLTFFPLGRKRDLDLSLFDEVRPIETDSDGMLDPSPLRGGDFGVAYFPDVGLTLPSVVLANLRLAPVQVASLGHSVSTFGAEIDYFLSGADVEPPDDPGRNYSERLVLLPGLGAVHSRPDFTPSGRRPTPGARLTLNCPWNAQKVNHPLVLTLKELIRRSRRPVRLRLFVSASLNRQNDFLPFVRDLEALLGRDHVEVCGAVPYRDYMAHMEEGDFTLDSYPFGGCNTVADSLFLRKLTVCREGGYWYNRVGPAMLRMVGLPELAVSTEGGYLDAALTLIHDDGYRANLQERLDRADLDATVFSTADAPYFQRAIDYLVANHDRLRRDPDRSPIRIMR